MRSWLIDTDGDLWPASSPELRTRNQWPSPSDFLHFAVARLGFAHIVETPQAARLIWRPTAVTEAAFAGTMLTLSSLREGRVVVSTLGTDWSHRLCASIGAGVRCRQ